MTEPAPSPSLHAAPRQRGKLALRALLASKALNPLVVAAAKALPAGHWQARLPVWGRDAHLRVEAGETVILTHPERCHVAQELFWHDGALASAQDRHALAAAIAFSRRAATFIDIGSYTGLFALAAARANPAIAAHAYEIVGENFLILWENVLRNDLADRVHPHLVAIGAADGTLKTPHAMNMGALASSVSLGWAFAEGLSVPIRRLDDLHAADAGPVAIKIDVEGFEMEVLDGAQALLARHRPDIVCEVLRRAARVPEMMRMLQAHGYRWLHITEDGFAPRAAIVADKLRRDWLLTTRTDTELSDLGLHVV